MISSPAHRNAINVLHLGGHITTISHAEADKHDGYDALYRFLADGSKQQVEAPVCRALSGRRPRTGIPA